MSARTGPPAPSEGGGGSPGLNADEFASRFAEASRALWYIAVGVLGQRSDAEDVVQEAAVIGLRKLAEFDPDTSFVAWMGEIVRNVARNSARKRERRQTSALDPIVLDASRAAGESAEQALLNARGDLIADERAFDDTLLRALRTLEENARVCLLLRVLGELPYAEIARILGIPEGTAMSHVHRTRRALRAQLAADGINGAARRPVNFDGDGV